MSKVEKIKELLHKNQLNNPDLIDFIKYHSLQHWFYLKKTDKEEIKSKWIYDEIKKVKQTNLVLYGEWISIWSLAKKNNINFYLYKGLALSEQLYGDALLRPTRDLDIFIDFNDIFKAHSILLSLGYTRVKPNFDLNKRQLKQIKHHLHHFSYFHKKKKVLIELHWQLFVPMLLMKNGGLLFKNITNNLNEEYFPRYKPEVLLHYLIIHAAMHHWFKLLWLADMDSLIRGNKINWSVFDDYTKVFDDKRMVNVSFKLLEVFFETPIPFRIVLNKTELKIYDIAIKSLLNRLNFLTLKRIERLKRVYYLTLLKKSLRYKWQCWYAPMTNLEDWKTLPLPNFLFILYFIFRPFLWFYHNYIMKK
ncbi:MAG: nucleotidyltransferase family protein [Bacteroidales bacterium]